MIAFARNAYQTIARALSRPGVRPLPENRENTDELLRQRKELKNLVLADIDGKGWTAFREYQRKQIADRKDALCCEMPVHEFTGDKGLEARGVIKGRQEALNDIAVIIEQGVAAEARMQKLEEQVKREEERRHRGALTRPSI